MLEFHFDEGYVDQMTIDPETGALLALTIRDDGRKLVGGQVHLAQDMVTGVNELLPTGLVDHARS